MKSNWKASGRLLLHVLFGSLKFIRSRVFGLLRKKEKTRIYVFNNGVLSWMDMQGNMMKSGDKMMDKGDKMMNKADSMNK